MSAPSGPGPGSVVAVIPVREGALPLGGPDVAWEVGPGGLTVHLAAHRAQLHNVELPLSKTEFDLLVVLLGAPGRVFERAQLLTEVWGADCYVGERTVDVHLKSLRRKIKEGGGDPEVIETVRGVGYRLREAAR